MIALSIHYVSSLKISGAITRVGATHRRTTDFQDRF